MSDKRLEEIRARTEAATPEKWGVYRDPACVSQLLVVGIVSGENVILAKVKHAADDADFIAHAREDVPYLLSLIDDAKVALKRLSQCSGGCDGPLGCMCSAPVARAALAKMEGRTQ